MASWEKIDSNTYRCVQCGRTFASGEACDCGPAVFGEIAGAESGAHPNADSYRRLNASVCLSLLRIARAIEQCARDENKERADILKVATEAYDKVRKATDSGYRQAKDREDIVTVERYERMAADISGRQTSRRAKHGDTEGDGVH